MAYQSIWYFTDIPQDITLIMERDLSKQFDNNLEDSRVGSGVYGSVDKQKRNTKNSWIPTSHWVSGFLWHYVQKANRDNFLYDLTNIDGESLQYTVYGEGQYYNWHNDSGLAEHYKPISSRKCGHDEDTVLDFVNTNCERVRKLSFSFLLSDPDEYVGGNLQFLDEFGRTYFAPRKRGTIVLFDSRTQHRVLPVKKGVRKSIVGWVIGPRWK